MCQLRLIALVPDERLKMRKILGVAIAVLLSAASAGAQDYDAGWAAYERGDYAAALNEWRPLAEAGYPEAQFRLGMMYFRSEGVPQNKAEAARWFRLAADQGAALAQLVIAHAYYEGEGVPQDKAEAVRWFRLAADQGNADAQFELGHKYFKGEGVTQN